MNSSLRTSVTLTIAMLSSLGTASLCLAQQTVAPEKIVGRDKCAQCHSEELKAWEASSHNEKAWSLLSHTKAPEFAKAIGVTNITGDSACTKCHGTHQSIGGSLNILKGNSCESCHGGAGGSGGWLTKHYEFGVGRKVTSATTMAEMLGDRAKENPTNRQRRDAFCDRTGMNRSSDPLALAKNCLSCHLVPNEALLRAGHPISSSFEMVQWSSGEVRHNFLLDSSTNAEVPTNWSDAKRHGPGRTVTGRKRLVYLAGKLADLEVSLRVRAGVTSTKRGSLGDEMNDRILDIQEEMEDLELPGLAAVVAALKDVSKKTLREIEASDKTNYVSIADAVAATAKQFVKANASGDKLPDSIKVKSKVKGDPYKG